jgi:hypothetical protein
MESVHPAAIRAANSRAEPHGCPVQRWEPTAAQPNQSTALANSTVRRTHRGRIGPPACRSSVMANHYPERPACVRDPRDCNPADTERVTTAPGDAFTTGEVRQYPTQDGKRTHLYLTADHGSARRTVRQPHMSADAAAQYLLDLDQPA